MLQRAERCWLPTRANTDLTWGSRPQASVLGAPAAVARSFFLLIVFIRVGRQCALLTIREGMLVVAAWSPSLCDNLIVCGGMKVAQL